MIAAALCLVLAIALLSVIASMIAGLLSPMDEASETYSPVGQVLQLALPVASWWLAVIGVARFFFGMHVGDLLSHTSTMRWRLLGTALLVGLMGFGTSALVSAVLNGTELTTLTTPVLLALVAIVVFVPLQASAEEVLFRGFAIQVILGKIGWSPATFWITAFVFSAGFSAAHATSNATTGVAYALFALLFAWLAWHFGGIEAAIGVHVANNLISLSMAVLRGDNLISNQSEVAASVLSLGTQLGVATLVCLVVVLIARREHAHV